MSRKKSTQPTGALQRASRLIKLAGNLTRQEFARRLGDADEEGSTLVRLKQAAALVQELGHMKGAAMKVGQMLVLEARDYLPDEVVQVLEQLQNKASFMPHDEVAAILRADLGKNARRLEKLSLEPIAAASIGQVHRAVFEGRDVAVKVQYPGVRDSIHSDMKILGVLLKGLATVFRREFEIDGLLEEFSEVFIQETDYVQEAQAAVDYRKAAATLPGIVVPEVFQDVSSSRVLTLSFEPGLTLTDWLRDQRPRREARQALAALILDLYTREFCDWGLVQTDPNPGNFLVRPASGEAAGVPELVLLDFGATKRYSPEFRAQYSKLVMAIFSQDPQAVMEAAFRMNLIDPREAPEAQAVFREMVFESMRPIVMPRFDFTDDEYLKKMRAHLQKLVKTLRYSPPPKELIFLHRKLGGVFQMLRQLEADLELRPYIERFDFNKASGS
ncbi:MAG: AarF/ABC1/UbiB kinase family protein [Oligoflexia bacterium]|nr:AarF/ABC1/UbiB kinase family protein [Oligoflexia bacterium]